MSLPPLAITEVVLRDAHQSLLATRMRLQDMLPIADKLDSVGYWSIESWGGATFDAAIRYLGEDPWQRLRALKSAMPKTPQQMLLRGQNLLGYRHYADDVVERFVHHAARNGVDIFRIFDALNDLRNLKTAIEATLKAGKHPQGTICYTVSPVHTLEQFVTQGQELQQMGCHSIAIKDMAGLLTPYNAYELVSRLKERVDLPLALHSHATTGLSTATALKAAEAGVDILDCAISSMSQTYGHSATESVVAMLQQSDRETGLDLKQLEQIAAWFRQVRQRYQAFEGSLRGVDSRILVSQVPGGMLTNLESQLRQQQAQHRLDEVLADIPKVRRELGYPPLVTPTSQIVATQAVMNVLAGERYRTISRETAALLRGEYGATPATVDTALQQRVCQQGEVVIHSRPADSLPPELASLTAELAELARQHQFELSSSPDEDTLIYAQFPQVGLKFLQQRHLPDAFEPEPTPTPAPTPAPTATTATAATYEVTVEGRNYRVKVSEVGEIERVTPLKETTLPREVVTAPMAGRVVKIMVQEGARVASGETLLILEAMKMETELAASTDGVVDKILVTAGEEVAVRSPLLQLQPC
ncbi:oxaloacetate decarboxylase subunit alpha [Ectothiorhodospiraceae bacterium BW-2]|nr:oxaloacetate decarboxylase subunit alpha [Ectothiorhodospiraceae bacterium BW-2]